MYSSLRLQLMFPGHVYEWSDVPYQDSYTAFLFNNNKELLNYKKLQNEAITHILSIDK